MDTNEAYIKILAMTNEMLSADGEISEEEERLQTAMYNSAFCALLLSGHAFKTVRNGGMKFVMLQAGDEFYFMSPDDASATLGSAWEAVKASGTQKKNLNKTPERLPKEEARREEEAPQEEPTGKDEPGGAVSVQKETDAAPAGQDAEPVNRTEEPESGTGGTKEDAPEETTAGKENTDDPQPEDGENAEAAGKESPANFSRLMNDVTPGTAFPEQEPQPDAIKANGSGNRNLVDEYAGMEGIRIQKTAPEWQDAKFTGVKKKEGEEGEALTADGAAEPGGEDLPEPQTPGTPPPEEAPDGEAGTGTPDAAKEKNKTAGQPAAAGTPAKPNPMKSFFGPKTARAGTVQNPVKPETADAAVPDAPPARPKASGIKALFGSMKPKTVDEEAIRANSIDNVKLEKIEVKKEEIDEEGLDFGKKTILPGYVNDGGGLFQHVHQVTLLPAYGDKPKGMFRFVFWPTRVVEMHPGKIWASFLVHVADEEGNEAVQCTTGNIQELIIPIDGYEFRTFGIWSNGILDFYVYAHGKTEKMCRIQEEVFKEEPEGCGKDEFLDQFRYERKGKLFHFVVPFKNNNGGEANIPITGYVTFNGKNNALERREKNTLRYKYDGVEKVVRGHWEQGKFTFSIEDAQKIVWDEL